ncbi:hypothetical protein [Longispora albida]|uniref:hypothetical protein n=1 Tax=Longispora albida TaxID=203523 RepID=UPI00058C73B2|nr:hypothetical protein [Longispora albida]
MIRVFLGLKLRILRNGFKGKTGRVVAFVFSAIMGLLLAAAGFAMFAATSQLSHGVGKGVVAMLGTFIVIGWIVMPVAMFGVDETVDPARFALLPIPKRSLLSGLLAAAFLGVPAIATFLATAGLILAGALVDGVVGALTAAIGVVLGTLLCVVGSRAVTSGFAAALRSRRSRDLALIGVTLLFTMIGPMISLGSNSMAAGNVEAVREALRAAGWSPLAAPYTAFYDFADGRPLLGVLKLAGSLVVLVLMLVWWDRSIESAMIGAVGGVQAGKQDNGKVLAVLGRTPKTVYGAIVAADMRGWWRDPRRRATLLSMVAASAAMPIALGVGPAKSPIAFGATWVGVFLALSAGNQFGFGGASYSQHIFAGVPGRTELRGRAAGLALIAVPALTVIVPALGALTGQYGNIAGALGTAYASFGVAAGMMSILSVYAAYALPESSNPFAMNSGGGCMKGLVNIAAMLATLVLAAPMALLAWWAGSSAWSVVVIPVSVAYGVGAVLIGTLIGGDALNRRAPELLAAVTPSR